MGFVMVLQRDMEMYRFHRVMQMGYAMVLLRDTEMCRRQRWRKMGLEIDNL